MRDFSGYLLIAVGLLILGLSGACTLTFLPPFGGAQNGYAAMSVAVFGSLPMSAGAALAAAGIARLQDGAAWRWARQALFWLVAALGFYDTLYFGRITGDTVANHGLSAAAVSLGLLFASTILLIAGARAALKARQLR